jgi:CheY-like chemotaxis protein
MRVRLVKKLAEIIDGIDLHGRAVGDVLNLRAREAKLLIGERWAVRAERPRRYLSGIPPPRAVAAERPSASNPKRILVVDDNDDLRALFQHALAAGGFDVIEAADGVQALQQLHTQVLHLVILDLRMPMLNGVDVHESIRSRKIPIVVVTGSPEDLGDLLVECVLRKPVMPETLLETVRRCLAITKCDPAAAAPH